MCSNRTSNQISSRIGNRINSQTDSRRHPHRGFTLIELLVAITILAIVAVMSWRGLDGIVRARLALNEELAQTRGMQIGFAQMQSDCAQLATPAMTGNLAPVAIAANRLLLIRTAYPDRQPGRLHVVSYRLDNGVLLRQESNGTRDLDELATLWQAALDDRIATPALPLQSGIGAMQLRLWDATAMRWRDIDSTQPDDAGSASPSAWNGLEVSLFPTGHELAIVKVLLLGAAG